MKIPKVNIAGFLGGKKGDEKKGKKDVTVYSGDMIGKYAAFGLVGSLALLLVFFLVYVFVGSFGSDKTSPELTDPVPIAMMVCIVSALLCVAILVMGSVSTGGGRKREKKEKSKPLPVATVSLPPRDKKPTKLKIAE